MGTIIDFDKEEIIPIKESEFRRLIKKAHKSWRTNWGMDEEDKTILLIANIYDNETGMNRTIVGHVTSCFEWKRK